MDSNRNNINTRMFNHHTLIDFSDDQAHYMLEEGKNVDRKLNFNYYDTPALDDSGGNDARSMAKIINQVSQIRAFNISPYSPV